MGVVVPFAVLALVAYSAAVAAVVKTFKLDAMGGPQIQGAPIIDLTTPSFLVWVSTSALLNICLTGTLLYYLYRPKDRTVSFFSRDMLSWVYHMVWETGLPATALAVAVAVAHIVSIFTGSNFWDPFLQFILGKVYALSFYFALNFRYDAGGDATSSSGDYLSRTASQSHRRSLKINIHTSRHVTTQDQVEDDGPKTLMPRLRA